MGLKKAIETPEIFLSLFNEWKEWKLKQVITVQVPSKMGPMELEHKPPLTWAGFDAWLFENGYLVDTEHYRANREGRYEDFVGVIRAINNIMFANKFEGAAVGAFKENIIARELGLSDKKDVEANVAIAPITGMKIT